MQPAPLENSLTVSPAITHRVTGDPATAFVGMYPREGKHTHTRLCTQMFTAALLITGTSGNNPNVYRVMNG